MSKKPIHRLSDDAVAGMLENFANCANDAVHQRLGNGRHRYALPDVLREAAQRLADSARLERARDNITKALEQPQVRAMVRAQRKAIAEAGRSAS